MIKVRTNESTGEIDGVESGLYDLARLIFAIATRYVPLFNIVLPFNVLLDVIEAVSLSLREELKVDYKFLDWGALLRFIKESAEAAANPTSSKERAEAIYALLVYMTNIEDKMTLEQFLVATGDAIERLPIPTSTPIVNGGVA